MRVFLFGVSPRRSNLMDPEIEFLQLDTYTADELHMLSLI